MVEPLLKKTPASVGECEKDRLLADGKMKAFKHKPGQAAVLTEDQLHTLESCTSEQEVVAFLTSPFESIFGEMNLCVVNSEEYAWLETCRDPRYNQKPDLVFCHRAIYTPRDPPRIKGKKVANMRRENDKFGVLTDWVLRDCIGATGEAKLKIDNKAFGEVINYGAHLCMNSGRDSPPNEVRLVLFDKVEFWLVEIVKGFVSGVTTCGWTVEGSKTLLSSFPFSSPEWMKLLDAACDHSDLVVQADAFLGNGAFGRVFRVHRNNEDCAHRKALALKLVLPGDNQANIVDLDYERQSLNEARGECQDNVMGVEDDAFSDPKIGRSSILLLSSVGAKVEPSCYERAITSLAKLHEKKILHGDPRLANLVSSGRKLLWIDFRSAKLRTDSPFGFVKDMKTLIESLLGHKSMPESLRDKVTKYNGKLDGAVAIIKAYRECSVDG